ncbi:hypothetical protein THOM_0077 [Trachipleistophora hominis]|uniref:Uncharacterized protein n=1 Tax=Trachipleistophora hominis TaxID=72359 RepID=L7JZM9_TRAHO|nr:hypothetical protein THOM_0077 [Trachipleistophora hominis]
MNDELLSVLNLCSLGQLEYLSIFIGKGEKTIDSAELFIGIINRSKLKHLIMTYSIAKWRDNRKIDMSNIFRLEFNTLVILEIKASGYNLTSGNFENELNVRKIRSLKSPMLEHN